MEVKIENVARDIVNAGIGFTRVASTRLDELRRQFTTGFNDLVARGAADNSDVAIRLRNGLGSGLTFVNRVDSSLRGNQTSGPRS